MKTYVSSKGKDGERGMEIYKEEKRRVKRVYISIKGKQMSSWKEVLEVGRAKCEKM